MKYRKWVTGLVEKVKAAAKPKKPYAADNL